MNDKIAFVRLPLLLVVLFFVGRIVMGATGASYDAANRVFSMVILQTHLALIWGALGRSVKQYRLFDAVKAVVIIVAVSQALIFLGTAVSYLAGQSTFFNYPEALNSTTPLEFGPAMVARTITFIVNCVMGAILGVIGWFLGPLAPTSSFHPR